MIPPEASRVYHVDVDIPEGILDVDVRMPETMNLPMCTIHVGKWPISPNGEIDGMIQIKDHRTVRISRKFPNAAEIKFMVVEFSSRWIGGLSSIIMKAIRLSTLNFRGRI